MRLSRHCEAQATLKGFDPKAVLRAALDPSVAYDSYSHPGQRRHIRDQIVAVVDPLTETVVTCYLNTVPTPRRPDQGEN